MEYKLLQSLLCEIDRMGWLVHVFFRDRENFMLSKSVIEMLNQGIMLLDSVSEEQYCEKSAAAYNASLGGHYRHVIDHLSVLIDGLKDGVVNYDKRQRAVGIETKIDVAKAKTQELLGQWILISEEEMQRPIEVVSKVSYADGEGTSVMSTVGREAMYVVIHGVHHYALIGVMCHLLGVELPAGFGVAPSTVAHEKKQQLSAAK